MRALQLWVLPNNGYETVPMLREHLARFRRAHPGLELGIWVRTEASLWRHFFRILKNPGQDPRPDVVQIPSHWTAVLARVGLLMDLESLEPGLNLSVWPAALREHCRGGDDAKVHSLPWWIEPRLLFFRRDALKRCGVDPKSLSDWDSMKEACGRLEKKWGSKRGLTFPIANPNPRESVSMRDVAGCVWGRGGDFIASDGSRSLLQRESSCMGVSDYFELLLRGWMPLKGPSGLAPRGLFEGSCAMQISGRLPARPFSDQSIGAVPFPNGNGKSLLLCSNLAIRSDCEMPREAAALLRELTLGEGGAAYLKAGGAIPAVEGGIEKICAERPELSGQFREALGRSRLIPGSASSGTVEKIFDRSMDRLSSGIAGGSFTERSVREALIHAGAEIDYVLSQGKE